MTREERDKTIRILQWLHDNNFLFRSTEEDVKYATKLAIQELAQEPMRDATPEERESLTQGTVQTENKCNPNDCPYPYGTYETCIKCKEDLLDFMDEVEHKGFIGYTQLRRYVEELLSVAISSAEPKWIPVSEKLPETDEFRTEFIVTIRCDTWEENKTMVAQWENTTVRGKDVSRWIWYDRLIPHGWEVIAWMPLPKPYQPQEREEI